MERFRWLFVGIAASLLLVGVGTGLESNPAAYVGLFGACVVLLALALWRPRRRRGELAWAADGSLRFVPAAPVGRGAARHVAAALGRVEARHLLRSGAFGVGLGLSAGVVATFGLLWSYDFGGELAHLAELLPAMVHPLAAMTVIATHRARTRGRRHGAEELFAACPTDEHTRNCGHLLTAWLPTLVVVLTGVALFGCTALVADVVWGPMGARQIGHLVGSAAVVAGGVALGLLLARVAPWAMAPVIAVVAVAIASINLSTSGSHAGAGARQLSTWLTDAHDDVRLLHTPWVAHHLWVLALGVVVGVLALVRDAGSRRPRVLVASAVAVAFTVGVGWAATRPLSAADARRIASLLNEPDRHQRCRDVGIAVCAHPDDDALVEHYAEALAPVLAAAPPAARATLRESGLRIRQGALVDVGVLDPSVRALLRSPTDVAATIAMDGTASAVEGARFWTAIGLTGTTLPGQPVLHVRGQARGVIVLWLATRGMSEGDARQMTSLHVDDHWGETGRPWPNACEAGLTPLVWARSDLEAVAAVRALPDDDVRALLVQRWDELVDRATSTDDLLAMLGLPPVGVHGSTPVQGCAA